MLHLGSWTIEYDAEATAKCVQAMGGGSPEECGCADCKRFAAARVRAYPARFVELLRTLGTEPTSESEIYYLGELSRGRHRYGGWFHVVGKLIAGPEGYQRIDDQFDLWFTNARDL